MCRVVPFEMLNKLDGRGFPVKETCGKCQVNRVRAELLYVSYVMVVLPYCYIISSCYEIGIGINHFLVSRHVYYGPYLNGI